MKLLREDFRTRMKALQDSIKFDSTNITSKDRLEEPIMVIANCINVYLMSDNAPSNNYGIALIAEGLHSDLPVIYVDKYFDDLDYSSKLFTIYHELGHYVNGDFTRTRSKKERLYNLKQLVLKKLPYEEQKADLYAYNKLREHFPTCIDKVFNRLFEDIRDRCIQELKDNYDIEEKKLNKYIENIKKEFNNREKTLRKNIRDGMQNFYDPK